MHYLIRLKSNDNSVEAELVNDLGILNDYLIPNSFANKGLLRHIDPYGLTCFNGLQTEAIIEEIEQMSIKKFEHEQLIALSNFLSLCEKCKNGIHKSIWIYGD